MPDIIKQLHDVKKTLDDPNQRQSYLQSALLQCNSESDEITTLINTIIRVSYHEGIKRGQHQLSDIGRNKELFLADEQAEKLTPVIKSLKEEGINNSKEIANALNQREIYTRRGHPWSGMTARLLVERIDEIERRGKTPARQDPYAEIIPLISELRQSGQTFAAIADTLNSNGHRTETGSTYNASTIRRLTIRNNDMEHKGGIG